MSSQQEKRGDRSSVRVLPAVSAGAYLAFAIGFLGIAVTLFVAAATDSLHGPYLIAFGVVCSVLCALCVYGAYRGYRHPELLPLEPVLYREYMRLRQDVTDRDRTISDLRAKVEALDSRSMQRRLTASQAKAIADTAANGLRDCLSGRMPPLAGTPYRQRLKMSVASIGDDSETIAYRNDFVREFEAAGFNVQAYARPAGDRNFEYLNGCVSLIIETGYIHENHVRPIVAAALAAAGIAFNEPEWPAVNYLGTVESFPGLVHPAALLVVGQRRSE